MSSYSNRDKLLAVMTWLVCLGLVFWGWKSMTGEGGVSPTLLPPPNLVFDKLGTIVATGAFIEPWKVTFYECLVAYFWASTLGLGLGYTISRSKYMVQVFEPLLSSLFTIPMILFFPLCVLYFGLGTSSKIVFGISVAFFPIVLAAISGFASVDSNYIQASRSMGASRGHMFFYVFLPAAFPVVLSGLRMGAILTFLSVLGSETLGSFEGLGHEIHNASMDMDPARMYAYIVIVVVIAALLNLSLGVIEAVGNRCYGVTDGK